MTPASVAGAFRLFGIALVLLFACSVPARAGGGQHYPNGAEDFVVGALPPPGTYLVNYLIFAQKDRLVDNDGDKVAVPADFEADLIAEVPRIVWVSPYTLFGASYGMHAFLPYYAADVEGDTPGGPIDDDDRGLGDIIFSPLILGWHFGPNLHVTGAVDFYAPTGNYDPDEPATQILSRNHWTVEPVVAATWLWQGFDLSAKLMYDFHTKNDEYLVPGLGEVELAPGQEFHVDWALGYSHVSGLRYGLVGYNHWQTTDDEIDGREVNDERSRVGGIGAGIKYWPNRGRFSMTFKHYWEYGARNIATGQQTQFKVSYKF